jgi:hypothetical protein
LTINFISTYKITGSLSDGQVVVNANNALIDLAERALQSKIAPKSLKGDLLNISKLINPL